MGRSKPRSPRIEEILAYPAARQAFDELVKRGLDKELLGAWLVVLPMMPKAERKDWASGSGMSKRSLGRFPSRLRRLGEEMSQVNSQPLFSPRTWLPVVHPEGREVGRRLTPLFENIGGIIRGYAAFLEGQFKRFSPKLGRRTKFDLDPRKILTIRLLEEVKRATGHFFYEQVATLLQAAYATSGSQSTVDAQALKMLYHRNPHLHGIFPKQESLTPANSAGRNPH